MPPPPATRAASNTLSVVTGVLSLCLILVSAALLHTSNRTDSRAEHKLRERDEEIDRLKGVVEAQKDSIRRLEEVIAWQAENPGKGKNGGHVTPPSRP